MAVTKAPRHLVFGRRTVINNEVSILDEPENGGIQFAINVLSIEYQREDTPRPFDPVTDAATRMVEFICAYDNLFKRSESVPGTKILEVDTGLANIGL